MLPVARLVARVRMKVKYGGLSSRSFLVGQQKGRACPAFYYLYFVVTGVTNAARAVGPGHRRRLVRLRCPEAADAPR